MNPEMHQFPHSALNLITKNKVSPTIYKYNHQTGMKYRPKSSTSALSGAYRKRSNELSSIILDENKEIDQKSTDQKDRSN